MSTPDDMSGDLPAPPPPPDYPPPPVSGNDNARTLIIIGWICAAIGVLIIPFVGLVGLGLGLAAQRRGNPMGRWVAIAGVTAFVVGMTLGLIARSADDDAMVALALLS